MGRLEAAVVRALEVLRARPAALVTDVDGTISPIVARPEAAEVSDRAREALRRLATTCDLVAVVTGREEGVARRMVGLEGIEYVGNYALSSGVETQGAGPDLARAREGARRVIEALPCVSFEEKGASFALHYRNCDEPDAVRRRLLEALAPVAAGAGGRLIEGKRVVEVVPAALPDKGEAIAGLARKHDIRGIVYLGDDVSDVAVFEEIGRRRAQGLAGIAIAVIDAETEAAVAEAADLTLVGVGEAEEFFERLAALGKGGMP